MRMLSLNTESSNTPLGGEGTMSLNRTRRGAERIEGKGGIIAQLTGGNGQA